MPRVSRLHPQPDGQKLGLVCPRCGCQHFRVVYLKRLPGGVLRRRRECRYCGRRMTTRETTNE